MGYSGSCHCGAVRFDVSADLPAEVIECNCSICRRKGLLLAFVPEASVTLVSGGDKLDSYRFNTHKIEHRFCTVCGVEPFAMARQGDVPMAAINIRCVPDADLSTITRKPYDGASR